MVIAVACDVEYVDGRNVHGYIYILQCTQIQLFLGDGGMGCLIEGEWFFFFLSRSQGHESGNESQSQSGSDLDQVFGDNKDESACFPGNRDSEFIV